MLISNFPGGKKIEGTATPSDVMAGETFMSANSNALQTGTLTVDDIVDGMEIVTISTSGDNRAPYVIDQTGYRVIAVEAKGHLFFYFNGDSYTQGFLQKVVFDGTYGKFIDNTLTVMGTISVDITCDGTSLSIAGPNTNATYTLKSGASIKILRIPR